MREGEREVYPRTCSHKIYDGVLILRKGMYNPSIKVDKASL